MIQIRRLFMLGLIALGVTEARGDSVYLSTTRGELLSINTATGSQGSFGPLIDGPYGLAVNRAGNLFVGSNGNGNDSTRIIELSSTGNAITNSYSSTYVTLEGLAVDKAGNVFAGDYTYGGVVEFGASGGVTGFGDSNPDAPRGLAFDSQGNLYVAGADNIMKFTPSGVGSVFATTGVNQPWGLAFDSQGNLYVANAGDNTIERFTPGGVGSVFATTGLDVPKGLAFDSQGNLYVANYGNSTIEEFSANGTPSLLATLNATEGAPVYLAIGASAVPEPSSLITFAIGAIGILGIVIGRRTGSTFKE